jgi:hypothetical protein
MHEPDELIEALTAQLGVLAEEVGAVMRQLEWAEQVIETAQRRHPAQADVLFHAFTLLTPRHESMGTPFVYRGYCRELLERVATGHDTRPGTDAEIALLCAEMSMHVPLNTVATGLYFRAWHRAFPNTGVIDADHVAHYEALRGAQIDDLETEMRRRLTVPGRRLPAQIECAGRHHGRPVTCRFTTNPEADLPAA